MIPTFKSKANSPALRGEQFGARFAANIAQNIEIYQRLFLLCGRRSIEEIRSFADGAFALVQAHSPSIAEEIQGMARGAQVPLSDLMALNARTELLAVCGPASSYPSECSVLIALNESGEDSAPVAVQNWDWLSALSSGWLLWTIEASDGHVIRTLTEYGIVGKIGVSSAGVGVLLNILSHEKDGQVPIGLPVHIAARAILEDRSNLNLTISRITGAPLTSSSSLSVVAKSGAEVTAFSLELFPGGPAFHLPNEHGVLVHTNHFLSASGALGDRSPKLGSSSFMRYEQLRRKFHGKTQLRADEALKALSGHLGGSRALCMHPIPIASIAEKAETIATVQLDIRSGTLLARRGGPCRPAQWVHAA